MEERHAPAATCLRTDQIQHGEPNNVSQSSDTQSETPKSESSGSEGGKSGSESPSPTSENSGKPRSVSKMRWPKPGNVRELAAQANAVTTLLLNGDIDLDTARAYSAMIRGVGQLVGAEVSRARMRREAPNLELE